MDAVKFIDGSLTLVRGLGMPYGGPVDGKDLEGEFFSPRTDFMFDFLAGERPVLYDHGHEPSVKADIVGRVVEYNRTDAGVWTIVQLDRRARYLAALQELVDRGAMSFSSGAYPSLVEIEKSGEILRWPWVELSLTPTPMNPYAVASKSLREFVTIPQDVEPTRRIAIIRRPRVAGFRT